MLIALWLAVRRLMEGLRAALADRETHVLLIVSTIVVLTGMVFYSAQEGGAPLDALYFTVTTLTTIGFGDFHPVTPLGKIFTIVYVLVGIGLVATTLDTLAGAVVKQRLDADERKRNERAAKQAAKPAEAEGRAGAGPS